MILSGQFLTCLRFNPFPPYLQVSGRSDQNSMSYADDMSNRIFSNQGEVTLRFMIRSGQFLNLFEILSVSTLSEGFRTSDQN